MGDMAGNWGIGGERDQDIIPLVPSLPDYTVCSDCVLLPKVMVLDGCPFQKATNFAGFWFPVPTPMSLRVVVAFQ